MTKSGRMAVALLALLGGCIIFTVFAAVGVYLVKEDARLSFYLALAAHAQILVGLTTLGALLVRRSIKVTRSGVELTDMEVNPGDLSKLIPSEDKK